MRVLDHFRRDRNGTIRNGDVLCNFSYYFSAPVVNSDRICPKGREALTAMRTELDNEKVKPTGLDFQRNSALSSVSCPANAHRDNGVGMLALCRALDGYSAVTRLNLEHCCLGAPAATTLVTQLKSFGAMPNLSTLILRSNSIGPQGGIALSELIKSGEVHHFQPLHHRRHSQQHTAPDVD